jgi:tetratricopeptide (TPR) repeat protein
LGALAVSLPALAETDFGDPRGYALLQQQHYRSAVVFYDRYLQQKPASAGALLGRGEAWLGMQDVEPAMIDLSRSISIKPQAEAYSARGDVQLLKKNSKGALQDYVEAVHLNGSDTRYLTKLASLMCALHDYHSSRLMWRKAVALEPKNAEIYTQYAAVTRESNIDEALKLATKAVELDPKQYAAWKIIAKIEFDKKHYQQAISAGKHAMIGFPHDTTVARWIVESEIAIKDFANAQALMQRLALDFDLRKESGASELYFMRGEIYEAMGDDKDALRDYGNAVAATKNNAEACQRRARLLKKMGGAGDVAKNEGSSVAPAKQQSDKTALHRL